ncbi:MAG: hypothetical protein MJ069_10670 [Salinivirgaceae bacterium]|nr:hypothetical protein [Salinivirgaceae bacterium]
MVTKGYNIKTLKFATSENINVGNIYYKVINTIDTNNEKIVVDSKNSKLTFIAGNSISLKPGFKVESGATFKATIDPSITNVEIEY